ncbi:MATE family efflux transporter [candidate division GN15 bacterium]|nr:MATE family efflux transporter [candidate division GN15 bacterium]
MDLVNKKVENVTSGSIFRSVFSLALPAAIGMFIEFALTVTDYYWVGHLGAVAQDAVTTSMVVIWTIFAAMSLVTVGVTATVSRHMGKRDFLLAAQFTRQGLELAAAIALVFSVVGFLVTPNLLAFMDSAPDTLREGTIYLRVFFVSASFFFIVETLFAAFRATGDTRTPTIIGAGFVLLNMALDPLLIFGWGPIPGFGLAGASLATAISVFGGMMVALYLVRRGRLGFDISLSPRLRPIWQNWLRIARIGLPIASQQLVFVVVYWFLIKIVHVYGPSAGAAMGIGNRMESFSFLTCYGFAMAASTVVGQNLGAGKPDRAAKGAWTATGIGIAVTFVMSIIFILFPEHIAGVFTEDPRVLDIAVDYLIILGLSQITMAIEIILEGAFGGAGDTVPPMVVLIPGAAVRIPLAYFLAFTLDWGISGVWWTLTITTTIKAVILAVWFARGNWKLKQV